MKENSDPLPTDQLSPQFLPALVQIIVLLRRNWRSLFRVQSYERGGNGGHFGAAIVVVVVAATVDVVGTVVVGAIGEGRGVVVGFVYGVMEGGG